MGDLEDTYNLYTQETYLGNTSYKIINSIKNKSYVYRCNVSINVGLFQWTSKWGEKFNCFASNRLKLLLLVSDDKKTVVLLSYTPKTRF